MAERFKKSYISAREFLDYWEKEIYELTQLDYFIYLLINHLGSLLENDYFAKMSKDEKTYLHSDEIASISFNICDNLQLFLDKNCFGICPLKCPVKLEHTLDHSERDIHIEFSDDPEKASSCHVKEDCLYQDLMNYVVMDSLLDFYNYELGIVLNEKDKKLLKTARFIIENILLFIRNHAQELLQNPNECASDKFNDVLFVENESWDEPTPEEDEMDEDESESWKTSHVSVDSVFSHFVGNEGDILKGALTKKIFEEFKNYLSDYIEISRVDEIDFEDIEEFFITIFPPKFIFENKIDFDTVDKLFTTLFSFIDQFSNSAVLQNYNNFKAESLNDLKRTFLVSRLIQKESSLVDYLLNNHSEEETVEGYFEIIDRKNGHFDLFDIHTRITYKSVKIPVLIDKDIYKNDVLHMHIRAEGENWTVAYFEIIYPSVSKFYLF